MELLNVVVVIRGLAASVVANWCKLVLGDVESTVFQDARGVVSVEPRFDAQHVGQRGTITTYRNRDRGAQCCASALRDEIVSVTVFVPYNSVVHSMSMYAAQLLPLLAQLSGGFVVAVGGSEVEYYEGDGDRPETVFQELRRRREDMSFVIVADRAAPLGLRVEMCAE